MKLYVGNLSYETTEDTLREAFSAYGHVVSVQIMTDRYTGQSRGFAFVEMGTQNQGERGIGGMNGKVLDGRRLRVTEAVEKTPREDDGQGFPRGGFADSAREGDGERFDFRSGRGGFDRGGRRFRRDDDGFSPRRFDRNDGGDDRYFRERDRNPREHYPSFGEDDSGFGERSRGFGQRDRDFGEGDRDFRGRGQGFRGDSRSFREGDRRFRNDDRGFRPRRDDEWRPEHSYRERGFGRGKGGFDREERGFGRGRSSFDRGERSFNREEGAFRSRRGGFGDGESRPKSQSDSGVSREGRGGEGEAPANEF